MSVQARVTYPGNTIGTIMLPIKVPTLFAQDILTTAFDSRYGACNYWIREIRGILPSWQNHRKTTYPWESLNYGGSLLVFIDKNLLDENEMPEYVNLTPHTMLEGIEIYMNMVGQHSIEKLEDMMDAEMADVIVQCAAFGEVVFG